MDNILQIVDDMQIYNLNFTDVRSNIIVQIVTAKNDKALRFTK